MSKTVYSSLPAMDREWGSKPGSGGVAGRGDEFVDRRERLRQLALETVDLSKDPFFMKNHLGTYECKLCLTLHNTEGNYLAHTQGKRHQMNILKRKAREAKDKGLLLPAPASVKSGSVLSRTAARIGRPGYKVVKQLDPATNQRSLYFEIYYPEIESGMQPRHRFMSAFEQHIEPVDQRYQYLLFSAEPYEIIGFKIPNQPIDKEAGKFYTNWDAKTKTFTLQLYFMALPGRLAPALPPPLPVG